MRNNNELDGPVSTDESRTADNSSGLTSWFQRWRRPVPQLCLLLLLGVLASVAWITLPRGDRPEAASFDLAQAARARSPFEVFDLSHASEPRDRILSGGPPVDGIPALSSPEFVAAREADFLQPADRVIGIVRNAAARAYPLRILDYHEAVNDRIGDVAFAVTYCPLCDSAAVFDRRLDEEEVEFGISGLLFNSNVLLYDRRQTGKSSLWSQVKSASISGPRVGRTLSALPLELTTWDDWRTRHPETRVLSIETGHARNYGTSAYGDYFASPELMFPVEPRDARLPPKSPVLGIWGPRTQRAYAISEFASAREATTLEQELDGKRFTLLYDPNSKSLRIAAADEGLQWMYSFWFAWAAFRPETEVFRHRNGS